MLARVSGLTLALIACSLWAQPSHSNQSEEAAIQRAKTLLVSSLDRGLPRVTLEFFLKYEGRGAPIQWRTIHCGNPQVI